ncbi:deoxyhypusine synthase-like isoform X1 [Cucumis melo var. makuwa]|uniref:Deoxyhypusine synthase-like isoform X1 n=1 Tax=Cucumis melo var. makuwa TaxID=1194695 RepID=A0A5D3C493_CUCMM|nr:deoxyhypusine synthase-like isoform X1 [Cucumis melo var. makuwa]
MYGFSFLGLFLQRSDTLGQMDDNNLLASVCTVVFKETENLEGKSIKIEGYDFNQGLNYSNLIRSMISTGFQAFNLGDAIEVVNQMLDWRLADENVIEDCSEEEKDPMRT